MWGEWLVYGTALGLGEAVEQAMKNRISTCRMSGCCSLEHAGDLAPIASTPAVEWRQRRVGGGGSFGGGGGLGGGAGDGNTFFPPALIRQHQLLSLCVATCRGYQ